MTTDLQTYLMSSHQFAQSSDSSTRAYYHIKKSVKQTYDDIEYIAIQTNSETLKKLMLKKELTKLEILQSCVDLDQRMKLNTLLT